MTGFIISREYGELIDGVRDTQVHLARAVLADDQQAIARYAQEMRDWRECMDRCPMFVQGEGRARG